MLDMSDEFLPYQALPGSLSPSIVRPIYKHNFLQQGSIRLLTVSSKAPGECELCIQRLVEAKYDAMSYCWGTAPANEHLVRCLSLPICWRELRLYSHHLHSICGSMLFAHTLTDPASNTAEACGIWSICGRAMLLSLSSLKVYAHRF